MAPEKEGDEDDDDSDGWSDVSVMEDTSTNYNILVADDRVQVPFIPELQQNSSRIESQVECIESKPKVIVV